MHLIMKTIGGLVLAACSAAALEKELVDQIVKSAQNIERDANMVSKALKVKQVDKGEVNRMIGDMTTDVNKLQELVTNFESTNPTLSDRDKIDWQLVKDKVQLLEIFHGQKQKLATEDMTKNRGMIRAHADGLVVRAQKLQVTANKLRRG